MAQGYASGRLSDQRAEGVMLGEETVEGRRTLTVEHYLGDLNGAAMAALEECKLLQSQLSPLLSPQLSDAKKDGSDDPPPPSEVTGEMARISRTLRRLRDELAETRSRL